MTPSAPILSTAPQAAPRAEPRRHAKAAALAALVAGLTLSACGGGDPAPDPAAGQTPAPTPTPPAPTPTPPAPTPTPPAPTPTPPAPTPTPPAPGPVAAGNCLNAALFSVGTTWTLTYQSSGALVGSNQSTNTLTRQTVFEGVNALEVSSTIDTQYSAPVASVSSTSNKSYLSGPDAGGVITMVGNTAEVTSMGFTASIKTVYTPAWQDRRWTLAAGESFTANITSATTTTMPGLPVTPPAVTTQSMQTVKFVGFEDVTVPAGTFAGACKFETTVDGATSTEWITASGQGVAVRSHHPATMTQGAVTLELGSGTVNGAPVR